MGFYPFVVWSFEHDAWWGPGRMGYTTDLTKAGRYSEADATDIVAKANRYRSIPYERAMTLVDAMEHGAPRLREYE
jgi:hypothetical protein